MNSQTSTKKKKGRPNKKTAESAENISAMERNQNRQWRSRHFVSCSFEESCFGCPRIARVTSSSFSSPEPTILLVCGRNRELWEQPFWNNKGNNRILPIRLNSESSSMAHARNGCSQSSRFLPQARRIVSSGDENASSEELGTIKIIRKLRLQTWQNNACCKTLINDLTFRMLQHTSSEVTIG